MIKYSKIKLVNKSRSIDFSDLQSFPLDTAKPIKLQSIDIKAQESKQQINSQKPNDSLPNVEEDDEHINTNEERFGTVKLSRNSSVPAGTTNGSNRFKIEKQRTTAMQGVVKRAFSMRRSSSVSEKYCRIHDQCVTVASPLYDENEVDDEDDKSVNMVKKKKKKQRYSSGRILKACKRLFGI